MTGYPAELEEHWTAGGEVLLIRPIRPSDAAQHDAFFHRLTPEDIRSRFFAAVRDLTPEQLTKFTRLDYERDMAFIAVREATGETVGVARLAREHDPLVAEFAVALQHDVQGRGLARPLPGRRRSLSLSWGRGPAWRLGDWKRGARGGGAGVWPGCARMSVCLCAGIRREGLALASDPSASTVPSHLSVPHINPSP